MKPFHKQLKDRLEATGDFSQPMWHFMADVLEHTANEADRWTNRADDARRIPDMIDEACRFCREEAKNHEVADPVVVRLEGEVGELRKQLDEARRCARHFHRDAVSHGMLGSDAAWETACPWLNDEAAKAAGGV